MKLTSRKNLAALVFLCATRFGLAGDIPLKNWTIPQDDLSKQVDITPGVAFVGMAPCRIVDTRPSQGFPAAWGPPALVMNATRNFDLNSAPHCTGIPLFVEAYSLNVTMAEPAGPGDLRMYPQGSPPVMPTSLMNWSGSGAAFAIANAAIVPAGIGGGVTVQMAGTSGHVIIDINGYWPFRANSNVPFSYQVDSAWAASFSNINTDSASIGVLSQVESSVNGAVGLLGEAIGQSGRTYGVYGRTRSTLDDSAGVKGVDGSGLVVGNTGWQPSGVLGESRTGHGVHGLGGPSSIAAVAGRHLTAGGAVDRAGYLGTFTAGVSFFGGLSGTGTKSFVEPHPTDPSKALKYISLEGPEAGTYFRGRGKFERGIARIEVPESFRIVTAEEGLSIQVTPIGEMASVAVMRIGLDGIVVKGSRSVEFFYTVNGVRKAYPSEDPIVANEYFVPEGPEMKMPASLSAEEQRRLIANGTYRPDGTVNMETAKRFGWDERWKKEAPKASLAEASQHAPR